MCRVVPLFSLAMNRIALISSHIRVKQLASLLKLPTKTVLKALTISVRKRLYCKFLDGWYQFPSASEIIVPFAEAKEYACSLNQSNNCSSKGKEKDKGGGGAVRWIEDKLRPSHLPPPRAPLDHFLLRNPHAHTHTPVPVPVVVLLGHFNHGKVN